MKSTQHTWQQTFNSHKDAYKFLSVGYKKADKQILKQALNDYWALPDDHPAHLPEAVVVAARLKGLNADSETLVATILGSY